MNRTDALSRTKILSLALASALVSPALLGAASLAGCGATTPPPAEIPALEPSGDEVAEVEEAPTKQPPPESGPSRDISFPPIARVEVANGLEVNTVEWHQLPVVYIRLAIRSGGEADPDAMPGVADLVATMLKEGTRSKSSAQLADSIEFLGADMWTSADAEGSTIVMRALADQLDEAMALIADVAMNPAFRADELSKLKRRELDRLSLLSKRPSHLAGREAYGRLYGDHPYAHTDTTEEVVNRVRRNDLVRWHRRHYVPNNAFLVVAGDVTAEQVQRSAGTAFASWRAGTVPAPAYAAVPERSGRQIVIVDRPESVQSVIRIANLAVPRGHDDWIPLMVANQVLGGTAASRLFMDLREQRSLTYGAYSRVGERVEVAPFTAYASVRTEVTDVAVQAFFEHLDRIVGEAPPAEEIANARRYLSDSFPLEIDTPGKIAALVADLRVFGLPDDYWDSFRTRIGEVSPDEALAAARRHIRPDDALVVIVGKAADIAEGLRRFGPVTVLDDEGEVTATFEAAPATEAVETAAAPEAAPAAATAEQ